MPQNAQPPADCLSELWPDRAEYRELQRYSAILVGRTRFWSSCRPHEAGSEPSVDTFFVDFRPPGLRLTGGKPKQGALLLKLVGFALNPAKASRFFDGCVIGRCLVYALVSAWATRLCPARTPLRTTAAYGSSGRSAKRSVANS